MRKRIILTFSLLMTMNIIVIISIVIYNIYDKAQDDVADFEKEETAKLKDHLLNLIEIPYSMIADSYQQIQSDSFLLKYIAQEDFLSPKERAEANLDPATILVKYGKKAKDAYMHATLETIKSIRFDNGEGYFWITDNQQPFPMMIMHPIRSEYEGKMMNDTKFNTEKYHKRNIYQARVELANTQGGGFIEYTINKPGSKELENKMSYSKLYQPLNWVISTGLYTDQIQVNIQNKIKEIYTQIWRIVLTVLLVSLSVILLILLVVNQFSLQTINAINLVKDRLKQLALGKPADIIVNKRKDEIGEMTESLNALVSGMNTYTEFAKEVGKGNLHAQFQALSEEDVLGMELLNMGDNLKKASEDDKKRNWANEGFAKFGALLREYDDLSQLSNEVLSNLIHYIGAKQGALLLLAEDGIEQVLEMIACYAFDRTKYVSKKIKLGEGLVGQTFIEKKTVYMTNVPNDYIHIQSALGKANPNCILITPLKVNEEVVGVMELASFNPFEPYVLEFVEKLSESIASAVSNVRVNEITRRLLTQSQEQAEQLRASEEELRQNMEELQATQDTMQRNSHELTSRITLIDIAGIASLELTMDGFIKDANATFLQLTSYLLDEIVGKHYEFVSEKNQENIDIWHRLEQGYTTKSNFKFRNRENEEVIIQGAYTCLYDIEGKPSKVIFLGQKK